MTRDPVGRKTKLEFANLRALSETKPRTKFGQVLRAWPQIQMSLDGGRTMSEVWQALRLDGIETTYGQFRTYAWRIRKRLGSRQEQQNRPESGTEEQNPLAAGVTPKPDPLANIRREQRRKLTSGFNYDAAATGDVE